MILSGYFRARQPHYILGSRSERDKSFAVIFAKALAILVFFLIVKLYLLSWYVWNQGIDPLNTIPAYLTPLIVGMDIGVSCAIALFYLGVHIIAETVLKSFGRVR